MIFSARAAGKALRFSTSARWLRSSARICQKEGELQLPKIIPTGTTTNSMVHFLAVTSAAPPVNPSIRALIGIDTPTTSLRLFVMEAVLQLSIQSGTKSESKAAKRRSFGSDGERLEANAVAVMGPCARLARNKRLLHVWRDEEHLCATRELRFRDWGT